MIDDSIVIATFNRAHSLCRALESFCRLRIEERVEWELVVVDNNSTDHTKQVCKAFTEALPLSYLFQPMQGKTRAQNLGISNSTGSFLLFTDDDVDLDSRWLTVLWHAAKRHPDADILGGKVLAQWTSAPPQWVADHCRWLGGVITHFDEGDEECVLSERGDMIFGANMAFRREIFLNGIQFREDMGPNGTDYMTHEETALIRGLIIAGHKCVYVPDAIVYHRNPAYRGTEAYVRKWFKASGKSEVRLHGTGDMTHAWFGVPRYLWRRLIESSVRYGRTRWIKPSGIWLRHEIAMATTWGMIFEYRRQARLREQAESAQPGRVA
jgi:glucosyl-dolichyl phosphate glucuronosyltransferase